MAAKAELGLQMKFIHWFSGSTRLFCFVWGCALLVGADLQAQAPSTIEKEFNQLRRLDFQLSCYRKALGPNLNASGQQRLALEGEVTDEKTGRKEAVAAVRDFPSKSKIVRGNRSFGKDSQGRWTQSAGDDKDDDDLLEMIHEDSIETFLYSQANARNARLLGSRFRVAATGGAVKERFLDIYTVDEDVQRPGSRRERVTKTVRIDSETLLLDSVSYERRNGGQVERIETSFEWTSVNGQVTPLRILRRENEQIVKSLRWSKATLSARAEDGLADAPTAARRP